jgi:hypothetical protein
VRFSARAQAPEAVREFFSRQLPEAEIQPNFYQLGMNFVHLEWEHAVFVLQLPLLVLRARDFFMSFKVSARLSSSSAGRNGVRNLLKKTHSRSFASLS